MPRSYVFPEMQDDHESCIPEADEKSESVFFFFSLISYFSSVFVSNNKRSEFSISMNESSKWY